MTYHQEKEEKKITTHCVSRLGGTTKTTKMQAMEKDVTSLGTATDRIRVYRPLTGAKDYSRSKLKESYDKISVSKAKM